MNREKCFKLGQINDRIYQLKVFLTSKSNLLKAIWIEKNVSNCVKLTIGITKVFLTPKPWSIESHLKREKCFKLCQINNRNYQGVFNSKTMTYWKPFEERWCFKLCSCQTDNERVTWKLGLSKPSVFVSSIFPTKYFYCSCFISTPPQFFIVIPYICFN